jgi:acetolactate synthase-1/2/3 large subunit
MAASWWARRYTQGGVDVCLVLGTDLDDVSVGPTQPIAPDGTPSPIDAEGHLTARGDDARRSDR